MSKWSFSSACTEEADSDYHIVWGFLCACNTSKSFLLCNPFWLFVRPMWPLQNHTYADFEIDAVSCWTLTQLNQVEVITNVCMFSANCNTVYLDKSPLVSKLSAPAQFSKEKKDQFISQGRNMDWIRDGMKLAASSVHCWSYTSTSTLCRTKMQGSSLWMRTTHFYHQ